MIHPDTDAPRKLVRERHAASPATPNREHTTGALDRIVPTVTVIPKGDQR